MKVYRSKTLASARRGFTLIEILVVAALISLLSGIAIFSINEFYENNIRKAVIGETHQIATAMSFAQDDLQFFPRLSLLNAPSELVLFNEGTLMPDPNVVVTAVDYYGFLPGGTPPIFERIKTKWSGPYIGMSQARNRSNRGTASGVVKMRLPDVFAATGSHTLSIVDWPADVWGTPYIFYQLKNGVDVGGFLVPEFLDAESEDGDFITAIVSHGKNGFPGGNVNTTGSLKPLAGDVQTLMNGALFVIGDPIGPPFADFTLKTVNQDPSIPAQLMLINGGAEYANMLNSLLWPGAPNPAMGQVGMLDDGNDDIVFRF